MDSNELKIILEKHKHWVNRNCEGWEKMRANLYRVDLSGTDLSGANLHYADLRGADLKGANLTGANLSSANLCKADLFMADLSGANLCKANLSGADLYEANLRDADLYNANLFGAELSGAYLGGTDLSEADLRTANLRYTNLYKADLRNADFDNADLFRANLRGAKGPLIEYRTGKILSENIIGYKKCKNSVIVTLEIPKGAVVFSINGYKCRTNKAKVINIDGADKGISMFRAMSYYIGDEFTIKDFDCEYNVECGNGIHFFMTREEAERFN